MTSPPAGLRKIAEGRQAEIYLWGETGVLRLLRNHQGHEGLEREAAAMRAAAGAGVPVPRPGEVVEVEGRPGLVMERMEGTDLFSVVGRRPWKLRSVAILTGTLHARLNAIAAPTSLPPASEHLRGVAAHSPLVPDDLRAPTIETLNRLPAGDRLLHGDFHPGNIMSSSAGTAIIDWTAACRGEPAADFANTMVLGRVSPMPPGVSRIAGGIFVVARKLLLRYYERAYRDTTTADLSNLDSWVFVCAVARLNDGIPEERPALLRLIEELRPRS
ncbi:MAG: phosphotransferase [Dehalococcoidia bacterium]|nr:phosphotransferase [Dehalococcoidia bacterium]